MVPTDEGQDSNLFLENQYMTVLGDNLDMVDQGGTGVVIDCDQTQEFLNLQDIRNLHKLFLSILQVDGAHVTRRCWRNWT